MLTAALVADVVGDRTQHLTRRERSPVASRARLLDWETRSVPAIGHELAAAEQLHVAGNPGRFLSHVEVAWPQHRVSAELQLFRQAQVKGTEPNAAAAAASKHAGKE